MNLDAGCLISFSHNMHLPRFVNNIDVHHPQIVHYSYFIIIVTARFGRDVLLDTKPCTIQSSRKSCCKRFGKKRDHGMTANLSFVRIQE